METEFTTAAKYFINAAALEIAGDFAGAFACYTEGNRIRKAELGYSIEPDRKAFSFIKRLFTDQQLSPVESPVQPIFIVGMPRSGTTLVEQILDSHPCVHGSGEFYGMDAFCRETLHTEVALTARNSKVLQDYYLGELKPPSKVFTDKLPVNFMWIGWILSAFPESRIIHTNRMPVAVCWSIFKRCFDSTGNGYAYDLGDIAEYYKLYLDLMDFWRALFPGRIYELSYEALTEDQEAQTRALLEYCGLPWQDACLHPERNPRAVQTASAAQVRLPVYQGSSEAWRRYECYLGPLVELLGCQ